MRFSATAVSSCVSRSDEKPASWGETADHSASVRTEAGTSCPIKMAPEPINTSRCLSAGAFTIAALQQLNNGPIEFAEAKRLG
jgi:hypothetical protein